MHLSSCLTWAAATAAVVAYTPAPTFETDLLAAKGIVALALREAKKNWVVGSRTPGCSLANVAIRKEWYVYSLEFFRPIDAELKS